MERKTQWEPLSTARKKKDLFIAIAGAKRKTPSLTGDEVSKWRRRPKRLSATGRSFRQRRPRDRRADHQRGLGANWRNNVVESHPYGNRRILRERPARCPSERHQQE